MMGTDRNPNNSICFTSAGQRKRVGETIMRPSAATKPPRKLMPPVMSRPTPAIACPMSARRSTAVMEPCDFITCFSGLTSASRIFCDGVAPVISKLTDPASKAFLKRQSIKAPIVSKRRISSRSTVTRSTPETGAIACSIRCSTTRPWRMVQSPPSRRVCADARLLIVMVGGMSGLSICRLSSKACSSSGKASGMARQRRKDNRDVVSHSISTVSVTFP